MVEQRRKFRFLTLLSIAFLTLAVFVACGGEKQATPTATSVPSPTSTSVPVAATPSLASSRPPTIPPTLNPPTATPAPSTPVAKSTRSAVSFLPGTAITISDGICQAQIPNDWTDNGTGRGLTATGGRYVLFGGHISDDEAWQRAVALFKQHTNTSSSTTDQGDDFVQATQTDGTGFDYRVRIGEIYCDFLLENEQKAESAANQQQIWGSIIASLAPAE